MSDIPPDLTGDSTDVVEAAAESDTATVDPEFKALLDRLGPFFEDVAKAAVDEAIANTPVPTFRPATVQGVSGRNASVLVDGDASPIQAQLLVETPYPFARVMVCFVPPSAVFVTGYITETGPPTGSIVAFAGTINKATGAALASPTEQEPPFGYLWCYGQAVSRATYANLFAEIGTTYGSGDGATTFNVPDLRGRTIFGLDNMGGSDAGRIGLANTLGTTGGSNTISTNMLPSHDHSFTPSGSISWSGSTSTDGSHSHTDNGHTHYNGWGTTYVLPGGGSSYPAAGSDSASSTGLGYASLQNNGSHSHTVTGSGSFTGNAGTTGTTGTGAEHLPPAMVMHWLIRI